MSDNPIQLIVAVFQDEKTAKVALKELKKAHKEKLIKIKNAAVLRKDEKGKLHIKETYDIGGGKGASLGGVGGAAIHQSFSVDSMQYRHADFGQGAYD